MIVHVYDVVTAALVHASVDAHWRIGFIKSSLKASNCKVLRTLAYLAMDKKRILLIAGSDSSGGALVGLASLLRRTTLIEVGSGLEADQKVIAAHGCYAMTATTALTAQNTTGVFAIHHIPSSFVEQQIDACITDIGVDVVKTGMP